MRRVLLLILCASATVLAVTGRAEGHDPLGRAQPVPESTITGSGFTRTLRIQLTDADSRKPVPAARVAVDATNLAAAVQRVVGRTTEQQPGTFLTHLRLPGRGHWRVNVHLDGRRIVPMSFSMGVDIGRTPQSPADGDGNWWLLIGLPVFAAAAIAAAVGWRTARRATGPMARPPRSS
jgi:hypothetical protein